MNFISYHYSLKFNEAMFVERQQVDLAKKLLTLLNFND